MTDHKKRNTLKAITAAGAVAGGAVLSPLATAWSGDSPSNACLAAARSTSGAAKLEVNVRVNRGADHGWVEFANTTDQTMVLGRIFPANINTPAGAFDINRLADNGAVRLGPRSKRVFRFTGFNGESGAHDTSRHQDLRFPIRHNVVLEHVRVDPSREINGVVPVTLNRPTPV